jgi:sugar lactone lactonase YvrE
VGNSKEKTGNQVKFLKRLRESSFPPAAIVGAFASFAATALGARTKAAEKTQQNASPVQIGFSEQKKHAAAPRLDLAYSQTLVLGSAVSKKPFQHSISAIAVDSADNIYVLGDGEVRIFNSNGNSVRNWSAPEGAQCMAVGPSGRIYFGGAGRVEIRGAAGPREGGFAVGESKKPASITAIRISGREILVADASARCIRRYTETGDPAGEIGTQNKTRGFMLPNRSLDMDLDAKGIIRATDSGRHRVSSWSLDGTPAGYFGKFGLTNPEDFVGCCNPVNIAVAPDGNIVTAEKVIARVKVFDAAGKLLALIGPEHFDPQCVHLYLAVDSKGRILVADPIRLEVKVFSRRNQSGGLAQI